MGQGGHYLNDIGTVPASLETGIKALMQDNLEEKVPAERIFEKLKNRRQGDGSKLMKKFELSYETAEAKLNEYRVQPA